MEKEKIYSLMSLAIIEGNQEEAIRLAEEALKLNLDPTEVIEKGYIPGIQKVGDLWEKGEYFLPELIASSEAMKAAMAILEPEIKKRDKGLKAKGKVVIGTVEGDIHDIGKNIVASMLQASGFEVHDLGADVKLEKFIDKAEEVGADIIGLSALLTTTMIGQKKLVEILKERQLRERYKVIVGGAPVTAEWAKSIGADGYAENAVTAVHLVKELLGQSKGR
ncbi:MAG: corrinoid protein [Candidatus Aminicenantes bacterium]|nr:corrinoid protein [Candidatus Aminicenantes bacterium]